MILSSSALGWLIMGSTALLGVALLILLALWLKDWKGGQLW